MDLNLVNRTMTHHHAECRAPSAVLLQIGPKLRGG